MSTTLRRSGSIVLTLAIIGLWATFLRPQSLGGPVTYLVIRGNSMEPVYHGGDLVIVRAAARYGTGDIVAYRVPAGEIGAGHLVIHRITGGDGEAGYLLRGDNNQSVDPWTPHLGDIAGSAWFAVPAIGRLMNAVHEPAIAGALAVAILATVACFRAPARRKPFVPPQTVPAGL